MQATVWDLSRLLGSSGRCWRLGRTAWYCGPTSRLSTSAGFTITLGLGALLHRYIRHQRGVEPTISWSLAAVVRE